MASFSAPVPVGRRTWSHLPHAVLLAMLLAICLPQYLCMGLWGDVTLHDLCARNMLTGGIHYRDIFETNLPGMDWLHVAIRGLLGWSFATIRAVDCAVVATTVWLLMRWLALVGASRSTQLWTALALAAFYFGTSEPCHCQRDVWMLVPALTALALRRRRLQQLVEGTTPPGRLALGGLVEGLCWGAAIWIKPHALVPLAACQLSAACLAWRTPGRSPGRMAADGGGLLAGGLLAGALGVTWLVRSGTWPHFLDVLLDWDRDYTQSGSGLGWRLTMLLLMFLPWNLVHLFAVPLALAALGKALRGPVETDSVARSRRWSLALFAALYLGWMAQALFLQKEYWYVRLPLIVLALPLFADWLSRCRMTFLHGAVLTAAAAGLALIHPMLQPERFALWGRCCVEGNTPELRDRLSRTGDYGCANWTALDQVRLYLQDKDLHDGELLCYNDSTHPLYLDLNVRPAGRFLHWTTLRGLFPGRLEALDRELHGTHPRYVVTDLRAIDDAAYRSWGDRGSDPATCIPAELAGTFPYGEPVVFQCGPYLVHRVRKQGETR